MVKVIYGEYRQQADLAGKSVAEVRELCKSEFSLSDRAQAILNSQQLKKKLEPETKLADEDELTFEEKSKRGLVLLGAFLLTLAITGGIFAYTQTTTTATIVAVPGAGDFASVSENTSGTSGMQYDVFGRATGIIPAGHLFDITPASGYTGDLELVVFINNPDQMIENYRFWMMRLELVNSANVSISKGAIVRPINLESVQVSFATDNYTQDEPFYVRSLGGVYKAFPWSLIGTIYDPQLYCEVMQLGLNP